MVSCMGACVAMYLQEAPCNQISTSHISFTCLGGIKISITHRHPVGVDVAKSARRVRFDQNSRSVETGNVAISILGPVERERDRGGERRPVHSYEVVFVLKMQCEQ